MNDFMTRQLARELIVDVASSLLADCERELSVDTLSEEHLGWCRQICADLKGWEEMEPRIQSFTMLADHKTGGAFSAQVLLATGETRQ